MARTVGWRSLLASIAVVFLFAAPAFGAAVTPGTPTLGSFQTTNVDLNPTIFWQHYTQTNGTLNDLPSSFQVEITLEDEGADDDCTDETWNAANRAYSSWNANSEPDDFDCSTAADGPACQGHGMGHIVCDSGTWTGDNDWRCGTFWSSSAPDSATSLVANTDYCVRVRWILDEDDINTPTDSCGGTDLGGMCAGSWSTATFFLTTQFDGNTLYIDTAADGGTDSSGTNNCQTEGTPCLTFEHTMTQLNTGDTLIIDSDGDGDTFVLDDNFACGGTDCWELLNPGREILRFMVRGGSAANRPIISLDDADCTSEDNYIVLTDDAPQAVGDDAHYKDLIFQGDPDCNTSFGVDTERNQIRINTGTGLTFENVDFLNNVNLWGATAGVSNDLTITGGQTTGAPKATTINEGISSHLLYGNYITVHNHSVENRNDVWTIVGSINTDHWLVEDLSAYDQANHPWRPENRINYWTLRDIQFGPGLGEGFSTTASTSSVGSLSVEDSSFATTFYLVDTSSEGAAVYLAITNSWFSGDTDGTRGGISQFHIHDNVIDASTRVGIRYSGHFWDDTSIAGIHYDGTNYVGCHATNPEYSDFLALAAVSDMIAVTDGCAAGRDGIDNPDWTMGAYKITPNNEVFNQGQDFTLTTGAPGIDTGHPDYIYDSTTDAVGGRGDIGPLEFTQAAATGSASAPASWKWCWGTNCNP